MSKIIFEDVCRYIGCTGDNIDDKTLREIDGAMELLSKKSAPKSTYRVLDITHIQGGVQVEKTALTLKGTAISQLLSECARCVLIAVTLGQKVDDLQRQIQLKSMSEAIIFDACASSVIECFCDDIEKEIQEKLTAQYGDIYYTDRFSPGYQDLALSTQDMLCRVLDTQRKIGLSVSASGILMPRKSITAVVGISSTPQKMRIRGCKFCKLNKTCEFKRKGTFCG